MPQEKSKLRLFIGRWAGLLSVISSVLWSSIICSILIISEKHKDWDLNAFAMLVLTICLPMAFLASLMSFYFLGIKDFTSRMSAYFLLLSFVITIYFAYYYGFFESK